MFQQDLLNTSYNKNFLFHIIFIELYIFVLYYINQIINYRLHNTYIHLLIRVFDIPSIVILSQILNQINFTF